MDNRYGIILAGGAGTRFWPLSREKRPKQFLSFGGPHCLLRATALRVLPLFGWPNILVVVTENLRRQVRSVLPELPRSNLIVEPASKNTAPAVGLACAEISKRSESAVAAVLPSDHHINREDFFRKLLSAAMSMAGMGGLYTLGIEPDRPETGYGYIRKERAAGSSRGVRAFSVGAFVEKPDLRKAKRFLRSGNFYWNAGIFIFDVGFMLGEMRRNLPDMVAALGDREAYDRIESISIDYGIAEKTKDVFVVPADIGWSDLGSFAAVHDEAEKDADGNAVEGEAIVIDSRGCYICGRGRPIACVGLDDVVVVDSGDAVLVCRKDRSQSVRRVVDRLKERGWRKLV